MPERRVRFRSVSRSDEGPRLLLMPGLGARADGMMPLVRALEGRARCTLVDYPEGEAAAIGPSELARAVSEQMRGDVWDGAVVSSYAGLVGAHLADGGQLRGLALVSSFTRMHHLGLARRRAVALMAPIAVVGRPGRLAASIAAARWINAGDVSDIVPTTSPERWTTWHRALAASGEPGLSLRRSRTVCIALQGTRDVLVPPGTLGRLLKDLPPGTEGVVLPGAGHVPYFTHAVEVASVLQPWLGGLGKGLDTLSL